MCICKVEWLFLPIVYAGVRGNIESEQVFAFSSSVQVKLMSELYIWKREGWKDSSYGKHFWSFSIPPSCTKNATAAS